MAELPTAEELLKHAREERELVSKWLKSLDEFVRYLESFLGMAKVPRQITMEESVVPESQRFRGKSAIVAAETVLRERGRAMHMKDIVKAILDGGYDKQLDPHKLYSSLFTNLRRRHEVFRKAERKPATFALAESPEKK